MREGGQVQHAAAGTQHTVGERKARCMLHAPHTPPTAAHTDWQQQQQPYCHTCVVQAVSAAVNAASEQRPRALQRRQHGGRQRPGGCVAPVGIRPEPRLQAAGCCCCRCAPLVCQLCHELIDSGVLLDALWRHAHADEVAGRGGERVGHAARHGRQCPVHA